MLIAEKITIIIILWILVALLVTQDTDFELFFVLIFIGVLVIRALTDMFIPQNVKFRLNLLIIVFTIVFIVIIGSKILTIISIAP